MCTKFFLGSFDTSCLLRRILHVKADADGRRVHAEGEVGAFLLTAMVGGDFTRSRHKAVHTVHGVFESHFVGGSTENSFELENVVGKLCSSRPSSSQRKCLCCSLQHILRLEG